METLKLFWLIIRRTNADRILYGFIGFFFLASLIFWWTDASVPRFQDALWLAYNISTSIGLGDYTVTTLPARITAIALGVYGGIIVAFIPGLVASYYMQTTRVDVDATIEQHYDELMNLPDMAAEDRSALAQTIRKEHGHGKS